MRAHEPGHSVDAAPEKKSGPWKESDQHDRNVKPERLDMLKFRCQEALEVVLDDEDAQEIRIAAGAANVPGQGRCAKRGNRHRMEEAKRVLSPVGQQGPWKHGPDAENNCRWAFGEN